MFILRWLSNGIAHDLETSEDNSWIIDLDGKKKGGC